MFGKGRAIDFLAIGDIVVDEFIRLKDAHVHNVGDSEYPELCVRFGDKVPFASASLLPAVGNSPNAAVSAARLGLSSCLITDLGKDDYGRLSLQSLKKDGVDTRYVREHPGKPTNHHYVLWYETDRTILIKHTPFEYSIPKLPRVIWLYLSSLGENSLAYHEEIAQFLKKHPETKLAFQPGTFQIKMGLNQLKDLYARTEVFFCNLEEAEKILGVQNGGGEKNVRALAEGIHALGPKMVVLSDGPQGAYLFMNGDLWHMPIYPDIATPLERTGAGDAFSSTFTSALALGKTPLEALAWAPINSMSVVQHVGAQKGLLSRTQIENYLKKSPPNYKAKKI